MNTPALVLSGGFAFLGLLLLALHLRSGWRWQLKGAMILFTVIAVVAIFTVLQASLGLPTPAKLPPEFDLHAGVVEEPDPRDQARRGAIYLWISPRAEPDEEPVRPRAHALPYDRELHEELAGALARLKEGVPMQGRAAPVAASQGFSLRAPGVELFEAPPPVLPSKPGLDH